MNDDAINHWIDRAKINESMPTPERGVTVIRNHPATKSRGQIIMEVSDKILPVMQKFFTGKRDNSGMLLQPAHIRGIALNYAEYLVKAKEQDNSAVA